jgi:hypothetical protein
MSSTDLVSLYPQNMILNLLSLTAKSLETSCTGLVPYLLLGLQSPWKQIVHVKMNTFGFALKWQ